MHKTLNKQNIKNIKINITSMTTNINFIEIIIL